MRLNVDHLLIQALQEDITSEDVSTNAVMPSYQYGQVQLICKEDGIIAGLEVFERVFYLLDESMEVKFYVKDGDAVKNGQLLAEVSGDVRVLLSGERTALNYLLKWRTCCFKLFTKNEWNCHLYKSCRILLKGFKDKIIGYKKNNTKYACI